MNIFSVLSGLFAINNFKGYGIQRGITNDDYFALLGSFASVAGCLRFAWSSLTDHYSYKTVYGILCLTQVALDFTVPLVAEKSWLYAIWISAIMFCEGGHFTLLPNVLKKIYGDQGTALYGIAFSYTGVCSILILILQQYVLDPESARSYNRFFYFNGVLSFASLVLLLTVFKPHKFAAK